MDCASVPVGKGILLPHRSAAGQPLPFEAAKSMNALCVEEKSEPFFGVETHRDAALDFRMGKVELPKACRKLEAAR